MSSKRKIVIIICAVLVALVGCFAFIHRRVIKALILGEELPELPEGHPECCKLTRRDGDI